MLYGYLSNQKYNPRTMYEDYAPNHNDVALL